MLALLSAYTRLLMHDSVIEAWPAPPVRPIGLSDCVWSSAQRISGVADVESFRYPLQQHTLKDMGSSETHASELQTNNLTNAKTLDRQNGTRNPEHCMMPSITCELVAGHRISFFTPPKMNGWAPIFHPPPLPTHSRHPMGQLQVQSRSSCYIHTTTCCNFTGDELHMPPPSDAPPSCRTGQVTCTVCQPVKAALCSNKLTRAWTSS
jgi:hypothetical protein